jgi:hypothetical protein
MDLVVKGLVGAMLIIAIGFRGYSLDYPKSAGSLEMMSDKE